MTTAEVLTQTLYADNTEEFITLVNGLAEEGTANSVGVLLSTFVDDFDYYDEMSVVMHAIERVNADVVYESLAGGLVKLNETAPGWCEELVRRHLRAPGNGEDGGFNVSGFVDAMRTDQKVFSLVDKIAKELVSRERVPAKVLDFFNS